MNSIRFLILFSGLLWSCLLAPSAAAQEKARPVDRLYMDMRASFHQGFSKDDYEGQFLGEHLNFQMMGHITPKVDYRIRQEGLRRKEHLQRHGLPLCQLSGDGAMEFHGREAGRADRGL